MKKIIFVFSLALISTFATAQKSQVVSAWNYMNNGELDKARTAINTATNDAVTSVMAKTWFYRGNIYLAIYSDTTRTPRQDFNDLQETFNSYMKAKELDTKGEYSIDMMNPLLTVSYYYFNEAVIPYNERNYQIAYDRFSRVSSIYQLVNSAYGQNIIDTSASFYTANCAVKLGKFDEAKKIYNELATKNFSDPEIYVNLADIAAQQKDTTGAIAELDKGLEKFPGESSLRIKQLNLYIFSHRFGEAIDKLKAAIVKEPNRADLYQVLGSAYENTKDTMNARKSYEKAIGLYPDDFISNYSLGALIYNSAMEKIKVMNDLPTSDQKQYDALKAETDGMLLHSMPYLEKAHELKKDDLETLNALKELYTRMDMLDKLKMIKEQLDNIEGGK